MRAALLLVLAGCLIKPGRPAGTSDAASGGGDGGAVGSDGGGGTDPCRGLVVIDNFDTTPASPCGTGTQLGMAVSRDGQALEIDPAGVGGGPFTAGCAWSGQPFGAHGAAMESVLVLTQITGDETALAVRLGGFTARMYVQETSSGAFLTFGDDHTAAITSVVYNQNTAAWWRIRPYDAHTLIGEYAADPAGTWIMLGSDTSVPATTGTATLSLTATQGPSAPGSAYLDNLETCLP